MPPFQDGIGLARHQRLPGARVRAWLRVWLSCLLLAALPLASAESRLAVVLSVHDAIGPASADYIVRGLGQAAEDQASLVVLDLDTPGGLDTSMRQIVQAILASPVPVVTYVGPAGARAASAGTFILYASHVAAMAPATTLGAATPVTIGMPGRQPAPGEAPIPGADPKAPDGRDAVPPGDATRAKQVNDAAAFIRGLAERHGRNAVWAERAVRDAASLTAGEALSEGVIDVVARDLPDLLAQIHDRPVRMAAGDQRLFTRGLTTAVRPPDARHRVLSVIANPSFALILLMVGVYGLFLEFSSPGFGIAGTVGAISLLLALFALQLLPVNYVGLGLILLGFALLAAELLTPTLGVLGVGGVVAFVVGGLMLFDRDVPGLGIPLALIFGLAGSAAAAVLLGGGMALRARRAPVVSGREALIGALGEVVHVSEDGAWAQVQGERWQVQADQPLRVRQAVRVVGLAGLVLQVQPDDAAPVSETRVERRNRHA